MNADHEYELNHKNSLRKCVLLAEDDVDDVEFLTACLQNLDQAIEIRVFSSGDQTISYFENLSNDQLPGLIILDYNLPAINGCQILTVLAENERYRAIPKIIWSTSNSSFFENECMDRGASAYFVKPADLSGYVNLAEKVVEYLRGK
jgi:CheY-like chemotaxis protein